VRERESERGGSREIERERERGKRGGDTFSSQKWENGWI